MAAISLSSLKDLLLFLGGANDLIAITPSDTNEFSTPIRMIYVGLGGDISITTTKGTIVIHKNTIAGSYIGPFNCSRVNATGTSAIDLIGYI